MGDEVPIQARWIVPGSIVVLAFVLRIWGLGDESLWIDEAASLWFVQEHGPVSLWLEVAGNEPHPPLYYTLLDGWTSIAGLSSAGLRALSVVFGTATVGLTYLFATEVADRRTGLLSSLLVGLSVYHVHAAQQARAYTLLSAATVLSMLLFVRALQRPSRSRLAAWVAAAIFLGYVHVFGLFILAAQFLVFVATSSSRSRLGGSGPRWRRAWGLIGFGLAPWILTVAYGMETGEMAGRVGWILAPDGEVFARLPAVVLGLKYEVGPQPRLLISLALAVGLALGWRSLIDGGAPGLGRGGAAALTGAWVAFGLIAPFVLSHLYLPVFLERYAIVASPALFVVLARGVTSLSVPLAVPLATLLVAGTAFPLPAYYDRDLHAPWDEVAGLIASRADEGDLVVVGNYHPGFMQTYTAFDFYFDRPGVPTEGIATDAITREDFVSLLDDRDTVWLVLSRAGTPNVERLQRFLVEEGYEKTESWERLMIDVYRFASDEGDLTASTAAGLDRRADPSCTSTRGSPCSSPGN